MSRYNTKAGPKITPTKTHEGGNGFKYTPIEEFVAILATGIDKTFYEGPDEREHRLVELVGQLAKKDPLLVAKAIVYARDVLEQRTVTHRAAAALAPYLSGKDYAKKFFSRRDRKENKGGVVYRVDDMLEILACYFHVNEDPSVPNSIKKGFAQALTEFDAYSLAKYQGKGRSISLVDVFNLVHPKPKDIGQSETFKALMTGNLKQRDTFENKHTKSGQIVSEAVKSGELTKEQGEKVLKEEKGKNWRELLESKKLGYLALLRNLSNIMNDAPEYIDMAIESLTNEKFIKGAKIFPHQIDLANEVIMERHIGDSLFKVSKALGRAYELSIPNMTQLVDEHTAVVFDTSGSMTHDQVTPGDKKSKYGRRIRPVEKAALIAATLAQGVGADVYHFATECEKIKVYPGTPVFALGGSLAGHIGKAGHGTNFNAIFASLERAYKRIYIVSDMQGADKYSTLDMYRRKFNCNPYIYYIDLCGYGTTSIKPSGRVYKLFGYSSEIYELAGKIEIDIKALIKDINAINL